MHCNGKCQMMKKLKQQENNESQNSDAKNNIKTDLLFFSPFKQEFVCKMLAVKKAFPLIQYKLTKDIAADFFHPPSLD